MFQETVQDVLAYLKRPYDLRNPEEENSIKVKRLGHILALDLLLMFLLIGLLSALEAIGWVPLEKNQMDEFLKQFPIWEIILLVVFFVPMVEELIFRLYLRFDRNFFILPILWIGGLFGEEPKKQATVNLRNAWDFWYPYIFYFAAIIFGIVHISNYEMTPGVLRAAPLLVLPQIAVGLLLGYLRVKQGFIWGFFLHALHNLVFAGLPLLIYGKELFNQ
ncbi:MAG: CPBP family intramembrane glutamic endopeptidase [Bacteroidota bacterium]